MVWTLTLQPESEGPSLISYAARLLSGGHCGLLSAPSWRTIVGESPAMKRMIQLAHKVAESEASSVLLQGESGTGKDLVAKAIHYGSRRADKPFVAINCAAIPATLIESELFGYEKGAFTDAKGRKEGLFE